MNKKGGAILSKRGISLCPTAEQTCVGSCERLGVVNGIAVEQVDWHIAHLHAFSPESSSRLLKYCHFKKKGGAQPGPQRVWQGRGVRMTAFGLFVVEPYSTFSVFEKAARL